MLRRHFHRSGPPSKGGRARDDDKKEDHQAREFPEVCICFMIYGGQVANASARHRKQERREVCSVKVAAPVYLDWSDKPITLDQGDHPEHVPSPGKYPLVVDPVIGNVRYVGQIFHSHLYICTLAFGLEIKQFTDDIKNMFTAFFRRNEFLNPV